MIPCPSCHQPVEILDKHQGTLFTCPHCNAVYFIDWNGQPEMAQHEPAAADEFVPPVQDFSAPLTNDYSESSASAEQSYEEQQFAEQPYEPNMEPPAEAGGYSYSAEPAEVPFVEGDIPAVQEEPYDFSQTLDSVNAQPLVEMASSTSDTADFSDVTSFANADTGSGPLAYTVTIDGIESSHMVVQLREAMTDSRFGWDVSELLSHVGGGRLVLRGLTPAKASVIINRLKYLPVKISWRQDVLSGS